MDKRFRDIIVSAYLSLQDRVQEIAVISLGWRSKVPARLLKRLEDELSPIIDNMFREGITASNLIVKDEVARLANNYNLPVKYNKDLLLTFNTDKSVFTGWYDNNYKVVFKKSEIQKLKSSILAGKYSGDTEAEMIKRIRATVNVSKQRAQLIARQETARLDTAAKSIYYQDPKVKREYDKVWRTEAGARPSHQYMGGQVADKDGWFTTQSGDQIQGAPLDLNCRCHIELVKKEK